MSSLVVTGRPGIIVVSGYVKSVQPEEVVIENNCYLPESKKLMRKRLRIHFETPNQTAKRLKINEFVIATVRPTSELIRVWEGRKEDSYEEYAAFGFNVRYTGSFDFPAYGQSEEEHVFCGAIEPVKVTRDKTGRVWSSIHVFWRRAGKTEERQLLHPSNISDRMEGIKKCIFITGPEKTGAKGKKYYFLKKVITVV